MISNKTQIACAASGLGFAVLFMESGAIYWHMVDLLWIVLFPLLYLMQ